MTRSNHTLPEWFDGRHINEMEFCTAFLQEHPMKCINGTFFTKEGRLTNLSRLEKEVLDWIAPCVQTNVAKRVSALLDALRMHCYSPPLPIQLDRIHVANGTLFLDGQFTEDKEYCINRLPVRYNPEAEKPQKWLNFLDQLLYPEDICTLQEFMGYCLIPSTKGQKMLFLIGQGGEGKSRIGLIMRALLGENMTSGSIQKIEVNQFARATSENILVMVDDDMKLEALPQTNIIKSIVTAEMPMDLERKGKQSYQGLLFSRFMVFGNGTLQSLYDRSEGFFRRQLILSARDKDANRKDDPYLAETMCAEAEGIFLWVLEGLKRLLENDFRFTISQRAQENIETAIRESNNIIQFMESEGYIRLKMDSSITSKNLHKIYTKWCSDNASKPVSQNTLSRYLNAHRNQYRLEHDNNVYDGHHCRVNGFLGIEALINPDCLPDF